MQCRFGACGKMWVSFEAGKEGRRDSDAPDLRLVRVQLQRVEDLGESAIELAQKLGHEHLGKETRRMSRERKRKIVRARAAPKMKKKPDTAPGGGDAGGCETRGGLL